MFLLLRLSEPGTLEDTIQCTWRNVETPLSGQRDGTRFHRMLKLAMTAFDTNLAPSVTLQQFQDLTNLHRLLAIEIAA
jgi:hypothetical protein